MNRQRAATSYTIGQRFDSLGRDTRFRSRRHLSSRRVTVYLTGYNKYVETHESRFLADRLSSLCPERHNMTPLFTILIVLVTLELIDYLTL